ncbi:hypothetical protein PXY63_002846 [Salmonella enterica]|uniref:hypothetical protein n=1 Tax=Salmonella TaxID=590 RepID=UPI000EC83F77|nr:MULTISPECIES: hypothetical protein [Salmonella]EDN6401839.1 hypothetical protein [Salmonella enterica]EEA5086215.1 hypothetical protein [Salmonella enterica subsp. enterica serovar Enteritidis]EEA5337383.1 hypothetical protein [Salmonella enterica subsp. enterica serovar Enteritidis]EEC4680971.1 hypothetical protein [Salmonella enterica subsp. enterica serovar Enteritidis]EEE8373279.1 hypothetical protein [Salmonella enterica subsp. enterica serovar Enteritidis]
MDKQHSIFDVFTACKAVKTDAFMLFSNVAQKNDNTGTFSTEKRNNLNYTATRHRYGNRVDATGITEIPINSTLINRQKGDASGIKIYSYRE